MRSQNFLILFIIVIILAYETPSHPKANVVDVNSETRNKVFEFLEAAFYAQVSLSQKDRSIEEIELLLSSYFTKEYMNSFLKQNLFEENGKYFTYGSDFAPYYIPYFRFTEATKVVASEDKIYVYQFFPENHEGPIGYSDHYEGILIKELEGDWKVSEYLDNTVPDFIINKNH